MNFMLRKTLQQRGYVLLVTLILVAIAGIALVGTSRAALRQEAGAIEGERELQRRWGTLSCRRVLLPTIERILKSEENRQATPVIALRRSITLGDCRVDLILADEQAKVNVNTLLAMGDERDAETRLRSLLSGSGMTTHIRLRPQGGGADHLSSPSVGSFGQVFDLPPSSGKLMDGRDPVADTVTCWDDGRLNFRRATERALRQVCVPALDLGQIGQIIGLRTDSPKLPLAAVLDQLQLTRERRAAAEALLTDGSGSHSLWILAHDGGRVGYELSVQEQDTEGRNVVRTFGF